MIPLTPGPTSVTVEVVGALADVEVERGFVNPLDQPIDVLLELPVPRDAALDRFTLTVGDRVIVSSVDTRRRAAAIYARAAAEGRVAGLLEEDSPSIVTQRIANVPPHAAVQLEVHLVQAVDRRDGVWEVTLPLTLAPRFTVDGDGDAVTDVRAELDVSVAVHAGLPLSWLESPSHPSVGSLAGVDGSLVLDDAAADRDLVVRWAVSGVEPQAAAWWSEEHGLVIIEPPADEVPISTPPQDVVFLVDTSESTVGAVSEQMTEALALALRALRPEDRFTLLAFDDVVRGVAVREPATWEAIANAEAALSRLPVGGGTRMAEALRFALAVPAPPDQPRTVVVLSDAAVGDEWDVLQAQLDSRPATVHTVAFGAAANHWLLGELAHAGGGVSTAVVSDVAADLEPVLTAMGGPVLTDIEITWGSGLVEPFPAPGLFAGQAMRFVTREASADPVQVTGRLAGSPWRATAWPREVDNSRLVALAYAQHALAELGREEVRGANVAARGQQLALEYQVASPWTSLVGADELITNPGGHSVGTFVPQGATTGAELEDSYAYDMDGATVSESVVTLSAGVSAGQTAPRPHVSAPTLDAASQGGPTLAGGVGPESLEIDGLDVTDALSVVLQPRVPWLAVSSTSPGEVTLRRGSQSVEAEVALHGVAADAVTPGGAARTSGSVVHDKVQVAGSVAGDRRTAGSTEAEWIAAQGSFLVWPGNAVRVRGTVLGDSGNASAPGSATSWGGVASIVQAEAQANRWDLSLGVGQTAHRWGVLESQRQLVQGRAQMQRGELALDLSAGATRTKWRAYDGLDLASDLGLRVETGRGVTVGARVDSDVLLLPDTTLWLPAPSVSVSVLRLDRVRFEADLGRSTSPDLAVPTSASALVVPRRWTGSVGADIGVTRAVAASLHLVGAREQLPFVASPVAAPLMAGPTVERDVGRIELGLAKTFRQSWSLASTYTWTAPQPFSTLELDPRAPFVPGYLDALRRHQVKASGGWDLYWAGTTRLGGDLTWQSGIGAQGAPWLQPVWLVGVGVSQAFDLRTGQVWFDLGVSTARNAPGAGVVPLEATVLLDTPPPAEPPWRLQGALRYSF